METESEKEAKEAKEEKEMETESEKEKEKETLKQIQHHVHSIRSLLTSYCVSPDAWKQLSNTDSMMMVHQLAALYEYSNVVRCHVNAMHVKHKKRVTYKFN